MRWLYLINHTCRGIWYTGFYSALITRDLQKTVVTGTRKFDGIGHTHFSHTTNNQHITK